MSWVITGFLCSDSIWEGNVALSELWELLDAKGLYVMPGLDKSEG